MRDLVDVSLATAAEGTRVYDYGSYEAAATRPADVPEGAYRFKITGSKINRSGDRVITSGMETADYLKNPIVLWMHDPEQPIGRVHKLEDVGDDRYAWLTLDGIGSRSQEIKAKIDAGTIRACSIGIGIVRMTHNQTRQPSGYDIEASILYELSIVSVPRYAEALRQNAEVPANLVAIARRNGWHGDPDAFYSLSADEIEALRPDLTLATLADAVLTADCPLLCAQMGVANPREAASWPTFEASIAGADRATIRRCAAAAGLDLAGWISDEPAPVVEAQQAAPQINMAAELEAAMKLAVPKIVSAAADIVGKLLVHRNNAAFQETGSAP